MPRASKPCACTGCSGHLGRPCSEIVSHGTSRCSDCDRQADKRRPSSAARGYANRPAWRRVRARLLAEQPFCVCTDESHGHRARCLAVATVADHYPQTRAELVAQGVRNPDAIERLRAVCASCHGKHTADQTPGGWNVR